MIRHISTVVRKIANVELSALSKIKNDSATMLHLWHILRWHNLSVTSYLRSVESELPLVAWIVTQSELYFINKRGFGANAKGKSIN